MFQAAYVEAPEKGPAWLVEGSAEYNAYRVASARLFDGQVAHDYM